MEQGGLSSYRPNDNNINYDNYHRNNIDNNEIIMIIIIMIVNNIVRIAKVTLSTPFYGRAKSAAE